MARGACSGRMSQGRRSQTALSANCWQTGFRDVGSRAEPRSSLTAIGAPAPHLTHIGHCPLAGPAASAGPAHPAGGDCKSALSGSNVTDCATVIATPGTQPASCLGLRKICAIVRPQQGVVRHLAQNGVQARARTAARQPRVSALSIPARLGRCPAGAERAGASPGLRGAHSKGRTWSASDPRRSRPGGCGLRPCPVAEGGRPQR